MLLAFLHWLSDGDTRLVVPVGSETAFSLRLPPVTVDAPVSIVLGDDAEEEPDSEDDLATEDDHLIDFDGLDDPEGPMDTDDDNDHHGEGTAQGDDREE